MKFLSPLDDPEDQEGDPAAKTAAASRSTWVSVAVNLGLTLTQIIAGVLSKSQGLIADGIHSLSDLVADFVVLLASHHSQKEADAQHPYGHHRFETAASLILGVLLLVVGLGMLWSAFLKLEQPETVPRVHLAAFWWPAAHWSPRSLCSVTCWLRQNASSRPCSWQMLGTPDRMLPLRWWSRWASWEILRATRFWIRSPP